MSGSGFSILLDTDLPYEMTVLPPLRYKLSHGVNTDEHGLKKKITIIAYPVKRIEGMLRGRDPGTYARFAEITSGIGFVRNYWEFQGLIDVITFCLTCS